MGRDRTADRADPRDLPGRHPPARHHAAQHPEGRRRAADLDGPLPRLHRPGRARPWRRAGRDRAGRGAGTGPARGRRGPRRDPRAGRRPGVRGRGGQRGAQPQRRARRGRGPLRADLRPRPRQGARGHRVLPLHPLPGRERGGLGPGADRGRVGCAARPRPAHGAHPARCDDHPVHPRHQAQRGRAGAPGRPHRAAARVGAGGAGPGSGDLRASRRPGRRGDRAAAVADPGRLLGAARLRGRAAGRGPARGLSRQGDARGEDPHHLDRAGRRVRARGAGPGASGAGVRGGRRDPRRLDPAHGRRAARRDPRPEARAAHDARRARRLPGQRERGPLPGGPRQPPRGRPRRARRPPRTDDRGRPSRGDRRREAVADPPCAGAAPGAAGPVPGPGRRLPPAAHHDRPCRRLRPRVR